MIRPPAERRGYVLVAVLLVIVVLSLAAYRFADAMGAEYAVAYRVTETAQAKAFAVSGVHYAAGMLADPNAVANTLGGNPYDNPQYFSNVAVGGDKPRGGGKFALVNLADGGADAGDVRYSVRYGVSDESGKININALIRLDGGGTVLQGVLMGLPNMTEEIADAITDWVDSDDDPRASGAESGSYSTYRAKNGPLSSLDELLLVRGVTPELLYGSDKNRNGRADPDEIADGGLNRGWSQYLTVYGRELNVDSTGQPRIYVNGTDLSTLNSQLAGAVGQGLADYICAYRMYSTTTAGNTSAARKTVTGNIDQLRAAVSGSLSGGQSKRTVKSSVLALYGTQVTLPRAPNARDDDPDVILPCPLNTPEGFKENLVAILDRTTAKSAHELNPRLNVNTAPAEVLASLGAVSQDEVNNAIGIRSSLTPGSPEYTTGAWLVTQAGMRPEIFSTVERLITGSTMTYRVESIGYFAKGGPVARVEAVIDTNNGYPRIVFFRDLTDLGPGFTPPRQ